MWKKIAGAVAAIVLAVASCGFGYLYFRKPAMAPPSPIQVEATAERIARGKYLFQKVMDCDGCHSEHDESRFGRPVVESGRGKGYVFPAEMGMPGTVVAGNITPDRERGSAPGPMAKKSVRFAKAS